MLPKEWRSALSRRDGRRRREVSAKTTGQVRPKIGPRLTIAPGGSPGPDAALGERAHSAREIGLKRFAERFRNHEGCFAKDGDSKG